MTLELLSHNEIYRGVMGFLVVVDLGVLFVHLFILLFHNLRSLKPDLLNCFTGASGDRMAGMSGYLRLFPKGLLCKIRLNLQ